MLLKPRIIILSIGLLLSSITLGLILRHHKPSFAHKYYTHLDQLEHEAFQGLTTLGLDQDAFEKMHTEIAPFKGPVHPDASQKPSEKASKTICAILKDFSINPASISIAQCKKFAPASAVDWALYVDEPSLGELSERAQKFALGHECQHILYQDDSRYEVLYRVFGEDNARKSDVSHPINKYYRFLETRADVMTALKNTEYAQGFYEFACHEFNTYGENPGITHPKNSERVALAKDICTNWGIQIA